MDFTEFDAGPPEFYVPVETVTLERMKLAAFAIVDRELMEHFAIGPQVDISAMDYLCDSLTLRIVQMVYGRTMEKVEVEYPADWWQAFRERWFPAWVLRRWPVKKTVVRLEAKELYPKLSVPDYQPQLQLYKHTYKT